MPNFVHQTTKSNEIPLNPLLELYYILKKNLKSKKNIVVGETHLKP